MFAFPAARIIACKTCLARFFPQMMEADANQDSLCDACLDEVDTFYKFILHFGPVVVAGDSCGKCLELLGGRNVADLR